jgi:hypothetical protein
MRHVAGDIVFQVRGVKVRYSPSQGTSTRYRTFCPHEVGVNSRTRADAVDAARHAGDWCAECAAEGQPGYDDA